MVNRIAKITEYKLKKLLHNQPNHQDFAVSISIYRSTFEPFLSVKNDDLGNYY